MTLEEALLKAKEGNFITNEYLDTYECIHYYNGKFYYEDGAVIPEDTMYENDYTKNANWRIKFTADQVDKEKLSKYIDDELEYAESSLQLAFLAAQEAKLAFLEAVAAQEEYDEKYGKDE